MIPNPNGDHEKIVREVSLQPDPLKVTKRCWYSTTTWGQPRWSAAGPRPDPELQSGLVEMGDRDTRLRPSQVPKSNRGFSGLPQTHWRSVVVRRCRRGSQWGSVPLLRQGLARVCLHGKACTVYSLAPITSYPPLFPRRLRTPGQQCLHGTYRVPPLCRRVHPAAWYRDVQNHMAGWLLTHSRVGSVMHRAHGS